MLLSGLVLVGCGSAPLGTRAAQPGSRTAAPPGSQPSSLGTVLARALLDPQLTVTGRWIYLWWQVSPPGSTAVRSELTRVDMATGKIQAIQRFSAAIDQVLPASGSLWVATSTTSVPGAEELLRLNPDTLQVTGRWPLGPANAPRLAAQLLVVAGGGLWVADGNRLLRFSLPGGAATTAIVLAKAASSDLAANAAGTVLIVGEADAGGSGAVQRRDPETGALLATYPVLGVAAPEVAGPIGSAVWVSEATGMMGYVQRLEATTMTAEGGTCNEGATTSTCVEGTNGIFARLAGGLLWVTDAAGGNARNYCANPVSGRKIAPITLPQPAEDVVLAITAERIFYTTPGSKAGEYVRQEAIPRACEQPAPERSERLRID